MNPGRKFSLKTALRLFTLMAVVFYVSLLLVFHHFLRHAAPLKVQFKSQAELAKLPIAADSYPCLMISRAKATGHLQEAIRQCTPALNDDADTEQYAVDLRSGLFVLRKTDLFVPDTMPLALTRAYRLWDQHSRAFGTGGNHPFDIFPIGDHFPYTYMDLVLGDGATVRYQRISQGTSFADFVAEHNGTPATIFQKSRVGWNTDHWELTFEDGTVFRFPEAYLAKRGVDGALTDVRNSQGEQIKVVRNATHTLHSLTSPHGHQITFTYDDQDRTSQAADDRGNVLSYFYNEHGGLSEVRENGHVRWRYLYDPTGMTTVLDLGTDEILRNQYSRGRIASMTLERTRTYRFDYLVTVRGRVEETLVTDPTGTTSTFKF